MSIKLDTTPHSVQWSLQWKTWLSDIRDSLVAYLTNIDTSIATLQTQAPTLATPLSTTSGTTKDFSIPTWATNILVEFAGVSTGGTSAYLIQLGVGGVPETTGYLGAGSSTGASTTATNFTTGFGIENSSAAAVYHGAITITLENSSSNTWVASGVLARSDAAATRAVAGSKSLAGTLSTVRITTVSGDTFDAGEINVYYF